MIEDVEMAEGVDRNAVRLRRGTARTSWTSIAFIVESVLLLMFLVGSLALLVSLYSAALNRSVESRTLDAATIAAETIAEHFAADPADVQESTQLGDLLVTCSVTDERRAGGVMHYAQIDVYDASASAGAAGGDPVYSIATSSYESEAA